MKPQFEESRFSDIAAVALKCPNCRGIWLHHRKVEVFNRVEDDPVGEHTTVENARNYLDSFTKTDTDMAKNPSLRRHGVLIHFVCECCDHKAIFSIAQHKGNTLISFQ